MTREDALTVAYFMNNYNFNVFDALHAVSCGSDEIISSGSIFDSIGIERIPLEK